MTPKQLATYADLQLDALVDSLKQRGRLSPEYVASRALLVIAAELQLRRHRTEPQRPPNVGGYT